LKETGIDPLLLKVVLAKESGGKASVEGRTVARFEPHIFTRLWTRKVLGKNRITSADKKANGYTVILPGMNIPNGVTKVKTTKTGNTLVKGYDVNWKEGKRRFGDGVKRDFAGRQRVEYDAIELASEKDRELAYQSASWGLGQIMGFNHLLVGYKSAIAMVDAFQDSVWNQRKAVIAFILNNTQRAPKTGLTVKEALLALDYDSFAVIYNGDTTGTYAADLRKRHEKLIRPKVA
jgi:hypothetical protein